MRLADVAGDIRRAIRVAAKQLAEESTPTEAPESQELLDLRVECEQLQRRINQTTGRAKEGTIDNLEQCMLEIAEEESKIRLDAPQRAAKVRQEFMRLSDETEMMGMTDDELRSMALRHGLNLVVDNKSVVGMTWHRIGKLFPSFLAAGDVAALDVPTTKVLDADEVLKEVREALQP